LLKRKRLVGLALALMTAGSLSVYFWLEDADKIASVISAVCAIMALAMAIGSAHYRKHDSSSRNTPIEPRNLDKKTTNNTGYAESHDSSRIYQVINGRQDITEKP
jgi:hypothetical protein